jgi:hypothetical protein
LQISVKKNIVFHVLPIGILQYSVRNFNTVYFKLFLFQNYMLAHQQRNELQYVVIAGTSGRLQCKSVCHLKLPKFTGDNSVNTVKPAHAVTSIKQSPVLKGHLFLSCHRKFCMN